MIAIGWILGGPEQDGSSIDRAIRVVAKAAVQVIGDFEFGTSPATNVVFHVPGALSRPDFDFIRDAKFSRKQKLLIVQVPVPGEVVASDSPMDYLIESLYGANAMAFEFFRQKGMEYPLAEAEARVAKVKNRAVQLGKA